MRGVGKEKKVVEEKTCFGIFRCLFRGQEEVVGTEMRGMGISRAEWREGKEAARQ